jgi:hypothetical protein
MSVQSRRKPSKLFTATVYGFSWVVLLTFMTGFVWGTLAEIRTQAVEGTELYITLYLLFVLCLAVLAFCKIGKIEASKRLYLTGQLANLTALLGLFFVVLLFAGWNSLAFFLGNPEPGVVSVYEAVFILVLCFYGLIFQTLGVMNDKYQNIIRIGLGGILFIISILLPKLLDSYALLRATCVPTEDTSIWAQCQERGLETIPIFTMAIASAATLAYLFLISIGLPTVKRFISLRTGNGAGERRPRALSDAQEGAEPEQNLPEREPENAVLPSSDEPLPSAARRNSHVGSFTAAVLGGVVVWAIQAIGERATKGR